MFDNSQKLKTANVHVVLTNGRELHGLLVCGVSGTISSALGGADQFIELHDKSGNPVFVAKHQIATLEPLKQGGKAMPSLQADALDQSRWHEVLGVSPTAAFDQVKTAYHALAKQYHPDLYPEHMPDEMRFYAGEMLTRINKAYEQFQAVKKVA
ncbi:MAG: J domain-containing protein [Pseudomonadota bacterium]